MHENEKPDPATVADKLAHMTMMLSYAYYESGVTGVSDDLTNLAFTVAKANGVNPAGVLARAMESIQTMEEGQAEALEGFSPAALKVDLDDENVDLTGYI